VIGGVVYAGSRVVVDGIVDDGTIDVDVASVGAG
jgi:hypothetical protein